MAAVLIVLSSLLTIGAIVPYLIDTVRLRTKPRVVTWFTWTLLTAITSAATFSDHQYATAILMLAGTLGTLLVVVLGWRYGDRKFDRLDLICQIGALAGLVLWLGTNSPALAVVTTMTIDFIGSIPTYRHSWVRPHEETWTTFAISSAGALCTLLALHAWRLTAILPPAYLCVANTAMASIIFFRSKQRGPATQTASKVTRVSKVI